MPSKLTTPAGYEWRRWTQIALPAVNVSVLYLRDEQIRDDYVTETLRFAVGNPARVRLNSASPQSCCLPSSACCRLSRNLAA